MTVQPFSYGDDYDPDTPIQQTPPDNDDEPRTTRTKQTRTRRPKFTKIRDEIKPDLEQILGLISLAASPFSPTAAEYNEQHVDKTIDDVARLCIRHPRLLEIIKQTGDIGAYVGLLELAAGLALAVLIDRERIDPEMFVARALHVTDAYHAAHPEGGEHESRNPERPRIDTIPPLLAGVTGDGA
jgi:hypothetical protein